MNKLLKTLLLTLLIFCMVAPSTAGTNKVLDLVLSGDFTDVLGSELVVNWDFANWTGSPPNERPDNWTDSPSSDTGTQIITNASSAARLQSASSEVTSLAQSILTVGKTYLVKYDLTVASGSANIKIGNTDNAATAGTNQTLIGVADTTNFRIETSFFGVVDVTFDNVSVKEVLSPWIPGDEFDISGGNAAWTSQGTDTTLSQPTIALVDGNTYKVYITTSGVSLAAGDTYIGIQLGGGTAYQLTEAHVFDQSTPLYLVCGSSVSSGLEITAVNGTAGDMMTIDDVSVIVEQMKPSTNLGAVFVTGNIRVPATGTNVVVNGDFETPGTGGDDVFASWSENSSTANSEIQDVDEGQFHGGTSGTTHACNFWRSGGAANMTMQQNGILTAGKTYLLMVKGWHSIGNLSIRSFDFNSTYLNVNSGSGEVQSVVFVATDAGIGLINTSDPADVTIDDLEIYEITTGPIDEYASNGTLNSKTKYTSILSIHADGSGGTEAWDLWWDDVDKWIISLDAGTKGDNYWQLTNASQIGSYTPVGNVTGASEVTFGPTDHTTATGSPAMQTSGSTPSKITLKTAYGDVNDNRETQWAWISVIKPLEGNDNTDRLMSMETADGVGYFWQQAAAGSYSADWSGTTALDLDFLAEETKPHIIMNISDIAANDSWLTVDDTDQDSQADAAGLDAVDPTSIILGARADADADHYAGIYAAQYRLDLTGETVDAAFRTGLRQAISSAALSSNYDAHAIALAIRTFSTNATGAYWALDEANSGDISSYYILAYDITDSTAKTSEFYGLVSPSGVTGTSFVEQGGYRSRYNGSGYRIYRDRYK